MKSRGIRADASETEYQEPKSSRRLIFRNRRRASTESNDVIRLLRFNGAKVVKNENTNIKHG